MISDNLIRAGFRINVEGDRLLIAPFNRLTETQRDWLKRHKDQLIAEIRSLDEFFSGDFVIEPAPVLKARCSDCKRLNRSKINPAGGLVDCEHLNHGRMQMTPLEPRNCQWFEPLN